MKYIALTSYAPQQTFSADEEQYKWLQRELQQVRPGGGRETGGCIRVLVIICLVLYWRDSGECGSRLDEFAAPNTKLLGAA